MDASTGRRPAWWQQAASGLVAGCISTTLLHPLDLAKVRYQLGFALKSLMVPRNCRPLVATLYRGYSANLLGNALSWSAYFAGYNALRPHAGNNFGAAVLAGSLVQFLTNPVWVAKTRMCQDLAGNLGFRQHLLAVLRDRAALAGIVPGLLGVVQGSAQMAMYERLKARVGPTHYAHYLAVSGASKATALVLFYPYQVVRSHWQRRPLSAPQKWLCLRQLLARPTLLYRGMGVALLRVLPASMVTFATYEWMLQRLVGS